MSDKPASSQRQPSADGTFGAPIGDLRSYVGIVRRRKWSLIFVVAITLAAAAAFSYRQTPMYRSTESVQVKPLDPNQALQGGYTYNFGISMTTEQALAASPAVATLAHQVAADEGVTSPDDGSLDTTVPTDTPILDITYSAADPIQARDWADAYAQGYILYRAHQASDNYQSAKKSYEDQISARNAELDQLRAQLATASKSAAPGIQAEIDQKEALVKALANQEAGLAYPVTSTAAESIAPATVPAAAYSPNWVRNMALALMAGLALGFAVVFIRERLDDRFMGREDLEETAGAPVLAIVPSISNWKRNTTKLVARDAPKTAPAEAYRTLRTNVAFMARTNDLKMISMVSPSMGEGKTTTTANLAVALAQSGKRVVALSCDLRKPRLHRFYGLSNDVGVTSILRDGVSVPEAAQRVSGIDTLRVIASGPVPHDPAELLGSEEMEEMLADLRRYADFVIVDTAPVLVVSDALSVAPKTDGVIIMSDAGSTMRGAVKATREQLELVGANIVGAVFNNFDPARAKMYYGSYKYHYYSSYTYQDKPERARGRKSGDAADLWK
jgi:capsular exopolysaccharide synthesis family protein